MVVFFNDLVTENSQPRSLRNSKAEKVIGTAEKLWKILHRHDEYPRCNKIYTCNWVEKVLARHFSSCCQICVTSKPNTFHRNDVCLSHTTINTYRRIEVLSRSSFFQTRFTGFSCDTIPFRDTCNPFSFFLFFETPSSTQMRKKTKTGKAIPPVMASCEAIDNGNLTKPVYS